MIAKKTLVRTASFVASAALVAGLAGCATAAGSATSESSVSGGGAGATSAALWDSSELHTIALDFDDADYDATIAAYLADGSKEWMPATVTIDGEVFGNIGIKLKGNSTLKSVATDSDPATLPWLIRLDEYVDGQNYEGETELVVRGNTSETSLNEAVSLELLALSGLANEEAVSSRFSVNGGDEQLRLVIQNPDDEWVAQEFTDGDLLYKAESTGDYSYRGDDATAYDDVFDQEAGDDNLEPLTAFLKFINESDDATFAADLSKWLDVDSFATYLAFQELVDNYDDISGPGNNSYLAYSEDTGLMTVVSWDLNLTFGARNFGGGGGGGGAGEGGAAEGGAAPDGGGARQPAGSTGGNGGGQAGGRTAANSSNILADRFMANTEFAAQYSAALTDLTATLFTSGEAASILDDWTALLTLDASDLVDADTIAEESAALEAKIAAVGE